ncbi:MAG: hypothetical protein FWG74_08755 [Planctomycetes bacterium]|nr:hypothetical protein [Planctomycetota bacterium]
MEATAQIISAMSGSQPEHAKALAYRLFTLAERKGWTQEAYAYNSLVAAWPDVLARSAEMRAGMSDMKQGALFGDTNS